MMKTIIEQPTKAVNARANTISFSLSDSSKDYRVQLRMSIRLISFIFAGVLILSVSRIGHAFCFEEAGGMYGVSPRLLWAIAKVESDFNPDAINQNRNGSYDVGLMQINSWWEKRLGNDLWKSLKNPCQNVKVGAWVLAQCIQRFGRTWKGIGCYNASSDEKRVKYAEKVFATLRQLNNLK